MWEQIFLLKFLNGQKHLSIDEGPYFYLDMLINEIEIYKHIIFSKYGLY